MGRNSPRLLTGLALVCVEAEQVVVARGGGVPGRVFANIIKCSVKEFCSRFEGENGGVLPLAVFVRTAL